MAVATETSVHERRFPRWVLVIIVMIAALLAGYVAWRVGLRLAIGRETAAMEAMGLPTTPDQMQAWYPPLPADAENAAEALLDAAAKVKKPEEVFGKEEIDVQPLVESKWVEKSYRRSHPGAGTGPTTAPWTGVGPGAVPGAETLPGARMALKSDLVPVFGFKVRKAGPDEAYPAVCMALAHAYLQANAEAMTQLREAAKIERSCYPADYELGDKTSLPPLGAVRSANWLFALSAVDAERTGDSEQATEGVITQLRIADSMRDEPMLISQMVRIACMAMAVNSLERAMNRLPFSDEQLKRIDAALAKMEHPLALQRAWAGKYVTFQKVLRKRLTDELKEKDIRWKRAAYAVSGMTDLAMWYYVQLIREYEQIAAMDPAEQCAKAKAADARVEARENGWLMPEGAVPTMYRGFVIYWRGMAEVRCARAMIAAERFRLDHGRWPSDWAELTPGYAAGPVIDPCSGRPVVLKRNGEKLIVYSTSDDGVDNGGVKKNAKGQTFEAGADILFELASPPRSAP